jgi:hypothetical protein
MNNRESSESNAVENARIRCDAVEYRKGFIEVLDNIHQGRPLSVCIPPSHPRGEARYGWASYTGVFLKRVLA